MLFSDVLGLNHCYTVDVSCMWFTNSTFCLVTDKLYVELSCNVTILNGEDSLFYTMVDLSGLTVGIKTDLWISRGVNKDFPVLVIRFA